MGPAKFMVEKQALYDVNADRLTTSGLAERKEHDDYAMRHDPVPSLPENAGQPRSIDGRVFYRLRGTRYGTSDDRLAH
jgi:hypothetical protein